MQPQMPEQVSSFHSRATVSRIASAGTPRKPSSRRSCRIKAMASRRFCRHSSTVSPCPLAPGISGQYAQYPPSDARSITAVNSFRMAKPYAFMRQATSAALGPNHDYTDHSRLMVHILTASQLVAIPFSLGAYILTPQQENPFCSRRVAPLRSGKARTPPLSPPRNTRNTRKRAARSGSPSACSAYSAVGLRDMFNPRPSTGCWRSSYNAPGQ
jgi:hypothetical protein